MLLSRIKEVSSVLTNYVIDELVKRRDLATLTYIESRWNPLAKNENGEHSYGLGQVNLDAHPEHLVFRLYDPAYNLVASREIYDAHRGDPGLKYGYYNGGGATNPRIPMFNMYYKFFCSVSAERLRSFIMNPSWFETTINKEATAMANPDTSGVKISKTKEAAPAVSTIVIGQHASGPEAPKNEKKNFWQACLDFFRNPGRTVAEAAINLNEKVINSKWAPDFVKTIMTHLNKGIKAGSNVGDGMLFTVLLVVACLAIALRIRPISKVALDLFEKLGGMAWAAKNKGGALGVAVWAVLTVIMKIIKALNHAVTFSFNQEKEARNVWKDENFQEAAPVAARAMDWGLGSKLSSFRDPMRFTKAT
jgi:hypothetical protein